MCVMGEIIAELCNGEDVQYSSTARDTAVESPPSESNAGQSRYITSAIDARCFGFRSVQR